jgi:nitrite reductase/ring-hydroxylating ferredoxin subunit
MIPVSLSGGVEPGARTGTSVNGLPVVVWRDADGSVHAWPDRCPHRGMRLSFGFVRRNALVCVYHGWSFGWPDEARATGGATVGATGGDAHCLSVPAHPGMTPPGKATIPVLPVTEALGMIWVGTSPGDTQPPPAAAIGDAPASGLVLHPVRSVTVRAPASALHAAFETTPPPGTTATETTALDDGGVITFTGQALRVIAAIQDRGAGVDGHRAATAHLVTTDAGAAQRQGLCEWAALVRDHLAAIVLP